MIHLELSSLPTAHHVAPPTDTCRPRGGQLRIGAGGMGEVYRAIDSPVVA
jgi:hypothetical protein